MFSVEYLENYLAFGRYSMEDEEIVYSHIEALKYIEMFEKNIKDSSDLEWKVLKQLKELREKEDHDS